MHAMLLDSYADRLDATQIAFLEAGIHVTGSGSLAVADTCLRRAVVDLLVIDLDSAGDRAGQVIRLAERRNPRLVTLMLTRDVAGASDRFADAFPSVHCVLDCDVAPQMVARMAQASIAGRAVCHVAPPATESARTMDSAPAQPQSAPSPAAEEERPIFASRRRKSLVPHDMLMAG